jgi:diguanylate cyclase (GGDEF)-like protein
LPEEVAALDSRAVRIHFRIDTFRLARASEGGALAYCRRGRAYLSEHPLAIGAGNGLTISVSMGVAAFPKHGKSLSEVTHRADQALYRGKQEGRARDKVWAA